MTLPLVGLCAFAFTLALVACEGIRRFATHNALFDQPNERSLHAVPTPRLGGVALVVAVVAVELLRILRAEAGTELRLIGVALLVALVGLVDDIRPLRASLRFLLQILGAAGLLGAVGVPALDILPGVHLDVPSWVVAALLVVWIVGVLNLYNFMDGMDGLAGTQAVCVAAAHAAMLGSVGATDLSSLSLVVGAASGGFLAQNFPPARIFMGDAGSTFVGFIFAGLGVLGMHHGLSLLAMALPLSPFLLDGTFTIFRRALRREAVWRAHRTHLYQRAVQSGLAHREVLLVYVVWMGLVLGLSALESTSASSVYAGWAVSFAALGTVWWWVRLRESQLSNAP